MQVAVSADALKTGTAIKNIQQYFNRVILDLSVTLKHTGAMPMASGAVTC